uniref:Uncharacterized protein n=1 Tax=Wuchereria bancrofti TaxID=6293 RepID=A0AAF5RX88_WUCBA
MDKNSNTSLHILKINLLTSWIFKLVQLTIH